MLVIISPEADILGSGLNGTYLRIGCIKHVHRRDRRVVVNASKAWLHKITLSLRNSAVKNCLRKYHSVQG